MYYFFIVCSQNRKIFGFSISVQGYAELVHGFFNILKHFPCSFTYSMNDLLVFARLEVIYIGRWVIFAQKKWFTFQILMVASCYFFDSNANIFEKATDKKMICHLTQLAQSIVTRARKWWSAAKLFTVMPSITFWNTIIFYLILLK